MKKFFTDMLAPSGKWSYSRVLLGVWFGIMCWFAVSNGRAFGKVLYHMFDAGASAGGTAVPYLEEFSYFLLAVFFLLLSNVFANKTGLNVWGKGKIPAISGSDQPGNGERG